MLSHHPCVARRWTLAIAIAALLLLACRSRPTQVTLWLDSDADPARAMTLTVVTLDGARSIEELRTAQGSVTRLTNVARALFPESVALVPRIGGARSGPQSMLAVLEIQPVGGQPALRIERWQRFSMIERTPQQARLYFNVECGSRAVGCTQAASDACTVSQRCIEQGLTCGDNGECVNLELPTVIVPPEVALDATIALDSATRDATRDSQQALDASDASDASFDATDANTDAYDASSDATTDAAACPRGSHRLQLRCIDDRGVRPIAPLSLGDTTLRRPTLRFALPAGATGAVVELCRDRACSMVIETLRVTGAEARPAAPLPASSTVYWRARARVFNVEDTIEYVGPTWLFHTPLRDNSTALDTSYGAHVDVNSDGFDDVIVAAQSAAPAGRADAGVVSVYFGSPTGIAATSSQQFDGPSAGDQFGSSVAGAGDVNGDGFGDVIIGAQSTSPSGRAQAGAASVFLGGASGLSPAPAHTFEGLLSRDNMGHAVAGAGDVDADGYADVIVAAPSSSPGGRSTAGAVSVFQGNASGVAAAPAVTLEGAAAGAFFGWSLASAGDVNGDGFSDIIVGARFAGSVGAASVFHGSALGIRSSPAHVQMGTSANSQLGFAVAGAGDFNGDGFADVVIGANRANADAGSITLLFGSMTGVGLASAISIGGSQPGGQVGYSVSGARDINQDGFADVVAGAPASTPGGRANAGAVHLLSGAAPPALVSMLVEGSDAHAFFGSAVSCVGDVNGDGFADIAVGASAASPGGRMNAGSTSIFHGSRTTIVMPPARTLEGAAAGDAFGNAIAR